MDTETKGVVFQAFDQVKRNLWNYDFQIGTPGEETVNGNTDEATDKTTDRSSEKNSEAKLDKIGNGTTKTPGGPKTLPPNVPSRF